MNSEELELSLRTEFENYLKGVFADMRQDVADFQKNLESEFEKHKSQMDEAFRSLSGRFESDVKFDKAFTESVVEHLRLARDDGAQLTAQAFAEAQQLEDSSRTPASFDLIRNAINDIGNQLTQSAILRSLVDHASHFTPRGAFFIVKNDNFVCWRKFDSYGHSDDDSVRSIYLPVQADTLLAAAVSSLSTQDSALTSHTDDNQYLDALGFGNPDRMYAIPLLARGRAVAVLFADRGEDGESVSVEAIESLVRVAGLTVELRAAGVAAQPAAVEAPSYVPMQEAQSVEAIEEAPAVSEPVEARGDATEQFSEPVRTEVERAQPYAESFETPAEAPVHQEAPSYLSEPAASTAEGAPSYETSSAYAEEEYTGSVAVDVEEKETQPVQAAEPDYSGYFSSPEPEAATEPQYADDSTPAERVSDFAFASSDSYEAPVPPEPVEEYAYSTESTNGSNGHSYEPAPEPVVEVAAVQPQKSRLSDRNVDLPIEVSDDERRLHNDARRFARLLVSEIKLYNEQKVNEGRVAADLYDRLREAIDRSREMYDKRVQPQVAAKFDYFHYELVSNLAEGNDSKLGASYPGATV